jgi:ADP-ribosylglycohydrolase
MSKPAKVSSASALPGLPGFPTLDRVHGCLLGGALGDALGYPIEFDRADGIARRFGAGVPTALSYAARPGEPARVSDDTQMTLFVAEGIARAGRAGGGGAAMVDSIEAALLRWYATQTGGRGGKARGRAVDPALDRTTTGWLVAVPELNVGRAPGNTCMSALAHVAGGGEAGTVAAPLNDSKGCGAVMRAAPCGLALATRAAAFALARDTGAITHGHVSGHLSAGYLAALVWDLARGASLDDALAAADGILATQPGRQELVRAMASARRGAGAPTVAEVEGLGGGWVGEEALAIAVRCARAFDTGVAAGDATGAGVSQALWWAVNHGGDSDSTGSIAGNLIGAMVGRGGLPAAWLGQLELVPVIERIGAEMMAAVA